MNYYAKAIDIIMSCDAKRIIVEIAKTRPSVIVNTYERINAQNRTDNIEPEIVSFTKHAVERMSERNIEKHTVYAVIKNGESWLDNKNNLHFLLNGFEVVMDGLKVITVYENKG